MAVFAAMEQKDFLSDEQRDRLKLAAADVLEATLV